MKKVIALFFILAATLTAAVPPKENLLLRKAQIRVPDKYKQYFKNNEELWLPPGFTISVFAAGVQNPRFLAWSPDSVLFAGSIDPGIVYSFPDKDRDGTADTALHSLTGLTWPHSVAFHNGRLYVAEDSIVRSFSDPDGDGIYGLPQEFISGLPVARFDSKQPNHRSRTIFFDTPRNHVYISVGASCDACRETDSLRATVLRYDIDGSNRTIFATGLRNVVGLDIDPVTGKLWGTVAERNDYPDHPEDLVTSLREGGFYGWPFAYGQRQWMDFNNDELYKAMLPLTRKDSALVESMEIADLGMPAHTTPLGIHFYTKDKFPAWYRNAAFLTLHNWRKDAAGETGWNNIVVIRRDSANTWHYADFLNGFLTGDTLKPAWGKPCGIISDAEGNIYFSSDAVLPAIYKISFDAALDAPDTPGMEFSAGFLNNPAERNQPATLQFSLPLSGQCRIALYDVRGNLVKPLLDGYSDAGEYRLPVDCSELAPGLYLYRLHLFSGAGGQSLGGKLIVH